MLTVHPHSVVVLAFVKSEGKQSTESILYAAETQALLGEKTKSLEGSLREKMVSVCVCFLGGGGGNIACSVRRKSGTFLLPVAVALQIHSSREKSSSPNSINSSNNRITFSPSPAPNGAVVASVQTADESWVDKLSTWQKRVV